MIETSVHDFPVLLKGEISECYVVCGKPRCRCRTGERHGPYYYRVWREGDRTCKAYVKPEDLEEVRAACAAYRQARELLRAQQQRHHALVKQIHRQYRASRKLMSGYTTLVS
jgi:hypothetical protein